MDFFDTPAILILGFVRWARATLQDYKHGKIVSSQSINHGQSSFMTVYADFVALLRWLSASVRPWLPERDTASAALSTGHRPILNPGLPAIACLWLQPPNHSMIVWTSESLPCLMLHTAEGQPLDCSCSPNNAEL